MLEASQALLHTRKAGKDSVKDGEIWIPWPVEASAGFAVLTIRLTNPDAAHRPKVALARGSYLFGPVPGAILDCALPVCAGNVTFRYREEGGAASPSVAIQIQAEETSH